MSEAAVENQAQLRAVLDQISFAPSCVNMGWQWQVEELRLPSGELRGWLVNTTFRRPDTHTGEVGVGAGRQELITRGASESAVVKTCWLLAELIVRHELMEAFLYQGVRIFDPHHSVADLSMPAKARERCRPWKLIHVGHGPDGRAMYETSDKRFHVQWSRCSGTRSHWSVRDHRTDTSLRAHTLEEVRLTIQDMIQRTP